MTIIIFFVRIAFSSTLGMGVALSFVVFLELDGLFAVHVHIRLGHAFKSSTSCLNLEVSEFGRELNLEQNEQVTGLIALLVERKTLVDDSHYLVRLDHEARLVLNSKLRAIEVGNHEVDASQSFKERDFLFDEQVSSLTFENLMGDFLNSNDDITRLSARVLIGLSVESVVAAIR